jgi:hypothetical protein
VTLSAFLFPILYGAVWIFTVWVLWTIAQALKGMNESFKEIAGTFRDWTATK